MRIVHIQLRGPYTDNWGYQENILPRCQMRLGDEVTIIAQNEKHLETGEIVETTTGKYVLPDGVKVIRIPYNSFLGSKRLGKKLGNYNFLDMLIELKPDIVFVHGIFTGYVSSKQLVQYKTINPSCVFLADSHEYGFGLGIRNRYYELLLKAIRRYTVNQILSIFNMVFCVTPQCAEFAKDYYKVPENIIDILPLGFDDELCDITRKNEERIAFRRQHNIDINDIVLIHGGKIIPRRKTEVAIKAVSKLFKMNHKVRLIVFGGISDEMNSIRQMLSDNSDSVVYLGHLTQKEYYKAFMASDIALFPGAGSVLWQEAIGCSLPLILCCKDGNEYLDKGGNVYFCKDEDIDDIVVTVLNIIKCKLYQVEHNNALEIARRFFSYEEMANKIRKIGLRNDR